jgi:aspartyl-tRNA(Asn)/glutamyl-tRNA(Gln) amidotransferase subunit B
MKWEVVIGLETHAQLLTQSKMFSGAATAFGAPPNTQACAVDIALPGVLPVVNKRAIECAIRFGLAVNGGRAENLSRRSIFARKNYFYPDLPKGYQISQYDLPMSANGSLEISDTKERFAPKAVRIIRAHLEEDAGKSLHDEEAGKGDSVIDLNRTGTPLLEIVSQPDLRSSLEAVTFLKELRLLLTYIAVSDCNMQEGSLRVDANINLHIPSPDGKSKIATPIVEVKNVNSFRAVERAMAYEAERQYEEWQETGRKLGDVPKQTRGWDDQANVTYAQRHKEESSDYRYFPDPDLVPVSVTSQRVDEARSALGELPAALRGRLENDYSITAYDSEVLVNQGRELVDYYVDVAKRTGDGKTAANWLQQDVLRTLGEQNLEIGQFPVKSDALADLIQRVKRGELDTSRGREVFADMVANGKSAADVMQARGIVQVDESELIEICREVIAANPKIVADVKGGKVQAAGNLIGQVKKRNPNVNPGRVKEICLELIAAL